MKPKPPKDIRQRRESSLPKSDRPAEGKSLGTIIGMHPWAFGLTVLGLLVTVVGLLITVEARPTASLGDPFNPNDVLTTPIIISNDGLTDLEDVRFYAYLRKVDYTKGNKHLGLDDIGTANRIFGDIETLAAGDKQEVTPMDIIKFRINGLPMTSADFAIVASFRPAYWPWRKWKFFRFTIKKNFDGTNRLIPIAAGSIESEFRKHLNGLSAGDVFK